MPVRFRDDSTDEELSNCMHYNQQMPSKRFKTPSAPLNVSNEVPDVEVADNSISLLDNIDYTPVGVSPGIQGDFSAAPGVLATTMSSSASETALKGPDAALGNCQIQNSAQIPLLEMVTRIFFAMEKIKRELHQLTKQQAELNSQFARLQIESGKQVLSTVISNPLPDLELPISNDTDLIILNQKLLEDASLTPLLVCYLSNLAFGKNLSFFTTNLFKKFLAKEVALQYSRLGRKGKKSLEDLSEIFNVLLATMACRFPDVRREELSERVGKVLSSAKEWGSVKSHSKYANLNIMDNSLQFSDD